MSRNIVKRTDRAKEMAARWNSTEPYRDGLTYRQHMSKRASDQRRREIEALRAAESRAAADPVPPPSADPAPNEPPATAPVESAPAGRPETPAIEEPSIPAPAPAEKKTTWGMRRWR